MDWDKLKIFHAVAVAGSVTSATVNLNLSQSAISRQIQSLEDDLKVKLFERHARGLTLTENGEYLFKTAHEVIAKFKEWFLGCLLRERFVYGLRVVIYRRRRGCLT